MLQFPLLQIIKRCSHPCLEQGRFLVNAKV